MRSPDSNESRQRHSAPAASLARSLHAADAGATRARRSGYARDVEWRETRRGAVPPSSEGALTRCTNTAVRSQLFDCQCCAVRTPAPLRLRAHAGRAGCAPWRCAACALHAVSKHRPRRRVAAPARRPRPHALTLVPRRCAPPPGAALRRLRRGPVPQPARRLAQREQDHGAHRPGARHEGGGQAGAAFARQKGVHGLTLWRVHSQVIGLAAGEPDFDTPAAIVEVRARPCVCPRVRRLSAFARLAWRLCVRGRRATRPTRALWSCGGPSAAS